tara:strand:- start:3158 stop:3718 length:561 start_codon:yes stop_codon:yes gene_type:complete
MTTKPKLKLTHFALFTRDIERMEDFYTKVMGFTVTDRGPFPNPEVKVNMVFMSSDPKEHHEFVLLTGHPEKDLEFKPNHHMSFLAENLDELRMVYDRAIEDGMEQPRFISHGNAWSLYFKDPEDNTIETYVHTPWHVPQPHGNQMDFSLSNDEIMRETEKYCRADPGFMTAENREAAMAELMAADS